MSELRCDCHPQARPYLCDADKLPWPHPTIVRCDRCGAEGEPRQTAAGAKWAWDQCERVNRDGDPLGVVLKKGSGK